MQDSGSRREAEPIVPDTKDWTWVLQRPCPECGFDARAVDRAEIAARLSTNALNWERVLERPDAGRRPRAGVWSRLEYACHVRDVHRIFEQRLRLMLAVDDPLFANWDQDEAAVTGAYVDQDPAVVSGELGVAAAVVARTYDEVAGGQWDRSGRRSNGSVFTVDTLGRYHLHDVEHHLHDVS
jgi:hypothetical protein